MKLSIWFNGETTENRGENCRSNPLSVVVLLLMVNYRLTVIRVRTILLKQLAQLATWTPFEGEERPVGLVCLPS